MITVVAVRINKLCGNKFMMLMIFYRVKEGNSLVNL